MEEKILRFRQAVRILPDNLRRTLMNLASDHMVMVEEIRLRRGRPPVLTVPEGEILLTEEPPVTGQDLEQTVQIASRWSVHTVLDQLSQGFVTVEGGHRLGVCGTVVMRHDGISSIRNISSVNLRIAHQYRSAAEGLPPLLFENGRLCNTLILAPPGLGKTTLLRDLIRRLSLGDGGTPMRVGAVDERGELAAVWQGSPQMDLGPRTDILDNCRKAQGIMALLRGMNPQVIAVDEITDPADLTAMEQAVGCGVALLATAHGSHRQDLLRRPLYRTMMENSIFQKLVILRMENGRRTVCVEELEETGC